MALDTDEITDRCRAGLADATPPLAVRDAVLALVANPTDLALALGPVERGGITTVHNSPELTIMHVVWTPGMRINPHNHRMWAVIGVYGGQEDNAYFRRGAKGLAPSGGTVLGAGEVLVLGEDAIHSVANSRREFALGVHVYGGDFVSADRSEWDPDTHEERPIDIDGTRQAFAEANARWLGQS